VSASCTSAGACLSFSLNLRGWSNTHLHSLARAWMVGLRHNSRHKFPRVRIFRYSRQVQPFGFVSLDLPSGVKVSANGKAAPRRQKAKRHRAAA
jgi:hypothetical protein